MVRATGSPGSALIHRPTPGAGHLEPHSDDCAGGQIRTHPFSRQDPAEGQTILTSVCCAEADFSGEGGGEERGEGGGGISAGGGDFVMAEGASEAGGPVGEAGEGDGF